MKCWVCGADLPSYYTTEKLSFRATCEKCFADLHCCKNCKFYKPGLPNDCMVPGTDYVPDRSKNNFCDEFKILGKPPEKKSSSKSFDDLFKT